MADDPDVRFWIDDHQYVAPRQWMVEMMSMSIRAGLSPNAALVRAMETWIKQSGRVN